MFIYIDIKIENQGINYPLNLKDRLHQAFNFLKDHLVPYLQNL